MPRTKRIDSTHAKAETPNPVLDAMGLTAVAKAAKADGQRNLLSPGFYDVDLLIDGKVDGKRWTRDVVGTLSVGLDSGPVASSSTPWAELLHSALCEMSAGSRRAWLDAVSAGQIPAPDCGAEKAAAVEVEMEPALKAYRATKAAPKRGNVAFVPAAPPKA